MKNSKASELYFEEPRLMMSTGERFLVRIIAGAGFGAALAAAAGFLLSDLKELRALGILIGLFLINRAVSLRRARKNIGQSFGASKVNVAEYFSPQSMRVMETALNRASFGKSDFFLNLFGLLVQRPEVEPVFLKADIPTEVLLKKIENALGSGHSAFKISEEAGRADLAREMEFLSRRAFKRAAEVRAASIRPEDLLGALLDLKHEAILKIIHSLEASDADIQNLLLLNQPGLKKLRYFPFFGFGRSRIRHRIMNRAWTARPTPLLDSLSEDWTDLARQGRGALLIGREKEYEELVNILSRPEKPNAVLIGEPGSGRDALVAHLAFKIARDEAPEALFDHRLVAISQGALRADAAYGELEGRLKKMLDEAESAGNVILYFLDIHNLLKSAGGGRLTAADIILPRISGSSFSVIGSTYPREYKRYIEPESGFRDVFEPVRLLELSEDAAVRILLAESENWERIHKIAVSFPAIKEAARLARRYLRAKLLPGSARELLAEAVSAAREKNSRRVSPDDVVRTAEEKINVPLHKVRESEAEKLLNLENLIHKRLVNQDEAVRALGQAMREYRSGLSRRGAPIASFLFVGPTGVGKTELAKIMARLEFDDERFLIRFDMSEYGDKQSFFRLIGSPDGNSLGALTEAVLEKPYSLVLLDEFEKAHPDVLNLFLQALDDGRLTDNLGRVVNFENTIIIASSNAHSEFIKREIEAGSPIAAVREQLKRKLTDYFPVELLNRFSGIIVFKNLGPAEIQAVARLALDDLKTVLKDNQDIDLNFDVRVVSEIARLGFDPVLGARPIRRVISDTIRSALAEKILRKEISRGGSVRVAFEDNEFRFTSE